MSTLQPKENARYARDAQNLSSLHESFGTSQQQLVNFSVRAQDFILKKGMHNYSKSIDFTAVKERSKIGRHGPQDADLNNFLDISTDLATPDVHDGQLVLPNITATTKTPLKGFLDISSTFKKMRHDF